MIKELKPVQMPVANRILRFSKTTKKGSIESRIGILPT